MYHSRGILDSRADVKDHVTSQFVTFQNNNCEAINELCCQHYNGHPIRKHALGKKKIPDFQIGDKVCFKKNNMIINHRSKIFNLYDDDKDLSAATRAWLNSEKGEGSSSSDCNNSSNNQIVMKKSVLDATSVADLIMEDDATFNATVAEMKEINQAVAEQEKEIKEQERLRRLQNKTGSDSSPQPKKDTTPRLCLEDAIGIVKQMISFCYVLFIS